MRIRRKSLLQISGEAYLPGTARLPPVLLALPVFLAALAGPGLVAPDLANNALPLYLSRPLTRWGYALARLIVIGGMLSVITWVPGLLLFALQVGLAGGGWFLANWTLGAGVVAGFLLWVLVLSLVAMASSAYVKWRVVAGAVSLAFFFILAGVQHVMFAPFVQGLVPRFVGFPYFWTYFAAAALLAGGIGMLVPRTRRLAFVMTGWMVFSWVFLVHVTLIFTVGPQEWMGVFEALGISGVCLLQLRSRNQA